MNPFSATLKTRYAAPVLALTNASGTLWSVGDVPRHVQTSFNALSTKKATM